MNAPVMHGVGRISSPASSRDGTISNAARTLAMTANRTRFARWIPGQTRRPKPKAAERGFGAPGFTAHALLPAVRRRYRSGLKAPGFG
jgi:hypothetical protein